VIAQRHAVVLAGGRGTRLRPYTTSIPKPLVPIGGEVAIVEIVLRQLAHYGFGAATLLIGHLGALIQAYIGDGSQWGLRVDYATDDVPLGTMGPVARILDRLPEHFLVMNGDILTDLDYGAFLEAHEGGGAPLTVATYARTLDVDFGVIEVSGEEITGFQEKPTLEYRVSMGVYGLSRDTLRDVPPDRPYGFDDLMRDLLAAGRHPRSFPFSGYWLDIGRPDDYDRANAEFEQRRASLLPDR
jgi:NDP-sugar pyrophosphorylase family protein